MEPEVSENTMRAHRIQVTVPQNHELAVRLPDDFPSGPAVVVGFSVPRL